ncbi:MAG: pilus assembly protein PilM [Candidatus Omnitrophica bacterium]|nr:pilus assembly protein PilM [Candidatus Omnitrophota bacterium]
MFNKIEEYIGVSLSDDDLKIVRMHNSPSKQKITNILKKDVREIPDAELPGVVGAALANIGVKKANAVCIVPSKYVTTKNIEIPSQDPAEIRSIVDLQAGRHAPYSREEILVGYISIGVFQRNYTKVLLVIVNRNVVNRHLDILGMAGLRVEKVLFAAEGIARFYSKALDTQEGDVPVGIIDIANQTTDFVIEANKQIVACRNIPLGLTHLIKDKAETQQKLVAELLSSIESYQNEDINKVPEVYVLTSADEKVKELQSVLQEKLKANVKVVSYLDHLEVAQPLVSKITTEYDDSFLSLVAAAVDPKQAVVDLTPDEIKMQRAIEEKGKQAVTVGVFGILLLLLVCGIFFSKIYFKSLVFAKYEASYAEKKEKAMALSRVAQKTRIIKDYLKDRMVSLEVVETLYWLIPDEIYLQSISLSEDGVVNIQGISESMSRVFNFVSDLEGADLFKDVKTKSTTAKKDRGKDVAAFEIEFRLETAKDEEA